MVKANSEFMEQYLLLVMDLNHFGIYCEETRLLTAKYRKSEFFHFLHINLKQKKYKIINESFIDEI